MSDYLADIAERSITPMQAIRPRPLSVFEQAAGTMSSPQQPWPEQDYRLPDSGNVEPVSLEPVAITTGELPVARREAQTISAQAPSTGVSAAIADPQPAAPTIVVQPASQGEFRSAAITLPPDHAQSIEAKVPADRRDTQAFEIGSNPPDESPDERQIVIPTGPPAKEGRIDSRDREFGGPVHQSDAAEAISERTHPKPEIKRVEMERSVAPQLPLQPLSPLHSRLDTKRQGKNEPMQKENSTPTINVTIGRIEVRAAPAPFQKQPKTKATDTMSLDEYMRRRNGGGR